jgi:hypothetical protein
MLIYTTTDGQRVTDFINPASEHDYMLKKTSAILAEMRLPGALRPSLGVAVVAGRAHLGAANPRIEGVIAPFDLAVLSHCSLSIHHRAEG